MDQQMVKYEAMCNAIAECHRIDEVKELRDKAVALATYARQAQNFELERKAMAIRLRAERRAGELLKEMKSNGELREGGSGNNQYKKELSNKATVPERITLEKLGIERTQSSVWQELAEIPEDTFESVLRSERPRSAAQIVDKFKRFYEPPTAFPEIDEFLETEHECPKCHYVWNGKDAPGRASLSARRRGKCTSCRQTASISAGADDAKIIESSHRPASGNERRLQDEVLGKPDGEIAQVSSRENLTPEMFFP